MEGDDRLRAGPKSKRRRGAGPKRGREQERVYILVFLVPPDGAPKAGMGRAVTGGAIPRDGLGCALAQKNAASVTRGSWRPRRVPGQACGFA